MTPGPPKPAAPAHDPCSLPTWGLRVGGWQPVQSIDSSIGTLKNCLSFLSCSFTCIFTCICTYVYTLSSRLCKNTYRHTDNTCANMHTCPRAHTHTHRHTQSHTCRYTNMHQSQVLQQPRGVGASGPGSQGGCTGPPTRFQSGLVKPQHTVAVGK